MKKDIPYPIITLTSCAERGFAHLEVLCINSDVKKIIRNQIGEFRQMGKTFPNDSKDFYVVPLECYEEAIEKFELKLPEYAALYLPSLNSLHLNDILKVLPRERRLVAWDNDFSLFITHDHFVLGVDYSVGDADVGFYEIKHDVRELPADFQVLFEVSQS